MQTLRIEIDLKRAMGISLTRAARLPQYRRDGRPANAATVWRHGTRGILAADGTRVKLETVRQGGRIVTTEEAVARFFARIQSPGAVQPRDARSDANFRRSDSRLTADGL